MNIRNPEGQPARAWLYAELDPVTLAMEDVGVCGNWQGMDLPQHVMTRDLRKVMVVLDTATHADLRGAMEALEERYQAAVVAGYGNLSHVARRFPPDTVFRRSGTP